MTRVEAMVSLEQAMEWAQDMPDATEGQKWGQRHLSVGGKGFLWERPLSKADIKRYGADTPPDGPIIALTTEDIGEREAIVAAGLPGFFTIAHFAGYPAYLIQLNVANPDDVHDAIVDAWLAVAPSRLTDDYVQHHPPA